MDFGTQFYHQLKNDKNKIYIVHAPEVDYISKGKAHKRYEIACKVDVAATSRGGWFVGEKVYHGMKDALE